MEHAWIQREGKLGGPGFLSKSLREQKRLLTRSVAQFGYRSTLGSVNVLGRNARVRATHGAEINALAAWLTKTYGGEGSFGPMRKTTKKRNPIATNRSMTPQQRARFTAGAAAARRAYTRWVTLPGEPLPFSPGEDHWFDAGWDAAWKRLSNGMGGKHPGYREVRANPAPGQHHWSKPTGFATCKLCGVQRKLEKKSGGYRTLYGIPGSGPRGGIVWQRGAPACTGKKANPQGYQFYVVEVDDATKAIVRVLTGNEYREDAQEAKLDQPRPPAGHSLRVYSKAKVEREGGIPRGMKGLGRSTRKANPRLKPVPGLRFQFNKIPAEVDAVESSRIFYHYTTGPHKDVPMQTDKRQWVNYARAYKPWGAKAKANPSTRLSR